MSVSRGDVYKRQANNIFRRDNELLPGAQAYGKPALESSRADFRALQIGQNCNGLLMKAGGTPHATDALDVAEIEPLPPESPLWNCPNLFITPHLAGASEHLWERQTLSLIHI